ncbi:hypothetical protein [Nocardioides sp.]|uniref:DUF7937 domain-containing protein n=1 Tax=Nocardioides sp. TaxID=35761 RepID=UPI002721F50B|nr:hypothetical protein [Nocardioides sp.]MDO9457223.1 hypothetical protein [Nocardioides sp.]
MANTCDSCGSINEGSGTFCSSCGQPLSTGAPHAHPPAEPTRFSSAATQPPPPQGPPLAPPTAYPQQGYPQQGYPQQAYPQQAAYPPQQPPPAAYPPQQQGYPQQGFPPQGPPQGPPMGAPQGWGKPAEPKVNPFLGRPVGDYVRDVGAVLALFVTLGMPWEISIDPKAGEQWWVVIAILLSVLSVTVPLIGTARVVPGWGPQHYRLTKLALNVPLLLSVVAAVIFELVHVGDDFEGGLGSGIAMALTGVALAVQPRAAEQTGGPADDGLWNKITAGVLAATVGLTALLFVGWFLHGVAGDGPDVLDPVTQFLTFTVAFLVVPLALVGYPAYQLTVGARSAAWRRALATVGFTVPVIALFALASDRAGLFFWADAEKWDGAGIVPGGGGLLVGAAAALVVTYAQQRATATPDAVGSWTGTVAAALQLSAAGSALTALAILLFMLDDQVGAGPIITIVLLLVSAGGAGFALTLLGDLRKNRVVVLGVLGGIAVIGCVALGILNGEDFTFLNNGWAVAAWISLPGLAAYALTAPAEVRTALGPLVSGGGPTGPGGTPYGQQPYPQQGYPPQSYPQGYPPQPGYPPQQPGGYQQPPPPSGPPLPPPAPGSWSPPSAG